jgi:hypothetical protein
MRAVRYEHLGGLGVHTEGRKYVGLVAQDLETIPEAAFMVQQVLHPQACS